MTSARLILVRPLAARKHFARPAVVVTDDDVLESISATFQVVPFTSTVRNWPTDVSSEWVRPRCTSLRLSPYLLVTEQLGNVGPAKLSALREVLSDLLGMA